MLRPSAALLNNDKDRIRNDCYERGGLLAASPEKELEYSEILIPLNKAMKIDRIPLSRALRVAVFCAPLLISLPADAQQNGLSSNEFYRQGDAFSEKVSGFFSGLFKGGRSNRASTSPPSYPTPAPYQRVPAQTQSSRSTVSTTYREAPATGAIVQPRVTSSKPKTTTTASRSKRSSNLSSVVSSKPKQTQSGGSDGYYTTARKKSESESVVMAPKNQETPPPPMETASNSTSSGGISPYAISDSDASLSVPPTESPKSTPPSKPVETKTTTPSTSQPTVSAGQEFPIGTVGKKAGRVVSPYPPHNELDVRGLPSGSLALDPTTQKVFKVP